MSESIQAKSTLFEALPPISRSRVYNNVVSSNSRKLDAIIVLDDDPTGTQTVHGVPVLTDWNQEVLVKEFENETPLFYILTNSRSLTEQEAVKLTLEIGSQIKAAAQKNNTKYWVISRSDSTLRGHYPAEIEALQESLDLQDPIQFVIPAFFEGGRYTINNVHYVEQGNQMVPAAQTIYAKDHVFGYQASNLVDWILEKAAGKVTKAQITTIDLSTLRNSAIENLTAKINTLSPNTICIVNAAAYEDLHVFSAAVLRSAIRPIFRTAASFVASIAGLAPNPLLIQKDLIQDQQNGGLLIVGSYVDTTTRQLQYLLKSHPNLSQIELDIPEILQLEKTEVFTAAIAQQIDQAIRAGHSTILYTSRNLVSADTALKKQNIGKKVSKVVTDIISQIQVQPSFLLTKGGITSSDIATKGLGIKRAMVLGQVIKGVPVWKLGPETKFPNSIQIIFPGNVGQDTSLADIVNKLSV